MKVAKQKRSEEIANKAQQMVGARQTNITNEINDSTGKSFQRAMDADRAMNKHVVMEHTSLGRRNQTLANAQNAVQIASNQSTPSRDGTRDELNVRASMQSQIAHTRRRHQIRATGGQDSLTNTEKLSLQGLPSQSQNASHVPQYETNATRPLMAGITQNPAEEARRRRKLEARIRELSK